MEKYLGWQQYVMTIGVKSSILFMSFASATSLGLALGIIKLPCEYSSLIFLVNNLASRGER